MLLVLKGHLKVLNTPYLVYSYNKQSCIGGGGVLFKGGVYSRAVSDRGDTVTGVLVPSPSSLD